MGLAHPSPGFHWGHSLYSPRSALAITSFSGPQGRSPCEGPSLPAVAYFLPSLASSLWLVSVGTWPPCHALVPSPLPTGLPRNPPRFLFPLPGMPLLLLWAWLLRRSPPPRQHSIHSPLVSWKPAPPCPSPSARSGSVSIWSLCLSAHHLPVSSLDSQLHAGWAWAGLPSVTESWPSQHSEQGLAYNARGSE